MDTTNYIALSGQMALRRQMDLIANNLANMNTPGYQRESAIFESYIDVMKNSGVRPARSVAFVTDQGTARDISHGDQQVTDNPLDVAIIGKGFFVIQRPDGSTGYTRDGGFQLSTDGTLVTKAGDPVLGANNAPIKFSRDETDIHITDTGSISSNQGRKGQLQVVQFDQEFNLKKIGGSLLTGANATPVPIEEIKLKSGVLESSNVKPVFEMTQMMAVLRSYQSVTGIADRYEEMRNQALQQLGRVQ